MSFGIFPPPCPAGRHASVGHSSASSQNNGGERSSRPGKSLIWSTPAPDSASQTQRRPGRGRWAWRSVCPSRSSSVRRNSGLPSGPGDAQDRRPAPALAEVDARDVAVRLKTHGPRRIGWVELKDETLTEIKVLSRFDLDLAGQMTVASDRSRGAAHPIQPALDGVTGPPTWTIRRWQTYTPGIPPHGRRKPPAGHYPVESPPLLRPRRLSTSSNRVNTRPWVRSHPNKCEVTPPHRFPCRTESSSGSIHPGCMRHRRLGGSEVLLDPSLRKN